MWANKPRMARRWEDATRRKKSLPERVKKAAFFDELEKIAWGGTYYHGTGTDTGEKILKEGLVPGKRGGVTTMSQFFPGVAKHELVDAGRTYVTPSKTVAKLYGGVHDAKEVLRKKIMGGPIPGNRETVKDVLRASLKHRPLRVSGKGLKLKHGLKMPGLEKYSKDVIPAANVSRSTPTRVGNVLRRVLLRR